MNSVFQSKRNAHKKKRLLAKLVSVEAWRMPHLYGEYMCALLPSSRMGSIVGKLHTLFLIPAPILHKRIPPHVTIPADVMLTLTTPC